MLWLYQKNAPLRVGQVVLYDDTVPIGGRTDQNQPRSNAYR